LNKSSAIDAISMGKTSGMLINAKETSSQPSGGQMKKQGEDDKGGAMHRTRYPKGGE
jgi:hypothetical protein